MKKILGGILVLLGGATIVTIGAEAYKRIKAEKNLAVGTMDLEEMLPEGFDEDAAGEALDKANVVAPLQGTPYENEDNTPKEILENVKEVSEGGVVDAELVEESKEENLNSSSEA